MDDLAQILNQYLGVSFTVTIILAFTGGLLSSFTPCIYPMIPITAAVVSSYSIGQKSKWTSLYISIITCSEQVTSPHLSRLKIVSPS